MQFSFFLALHEFTFLQLFEVSLVAYVRVELVEGVSFGAEVFFKPASVNLPKILEFLLLK